MQREELAAWLRLSLTPGVGDTTARRLLAAFGLPENIFSAGSGSLAKVVSAAQAAALAAEPEGFAQQLELTWQWLSGAPQQRRVLTLADADYPPALLNIEDPPLLLYLLGQPLDERRACVAVVGSRNPTPQGRDNAHKFSRAFADAGVTVVSGLALGVDTAAHEGALEGASAAGVTTIAVVGTGLDRVYPSRNRELAHRIAERGMLISEYPLGTPPLAPNFPKRNRLISGLSQGTLVVEAALQSGSLITARIAAEQGKEVFAIPGSIHSPQSRGCHALLKQGAKLVESAQDVLEELRISPASISLAPSRPTTNEMPSPRQEDRAILDALGFDPVSLDALLDRTGLPTALLQARLLELELAGEVARLPGGLFQRVVAA